MTPWTVARQAPLSVGGGDEGEEFPDPNSPSPPWLPGSASSTAPASQVWVGSSGSVRALLVELGEAGSSLFPPHPLMSERAGEAGGVGNELWLVRVLSH